jgi:hypothetical protein
LRPGGRAKTRYFERGGGLEHSFLAIAARQRVVGMPDGVGDDAVARLELDRYVTVVSGGDRVGEN